MADRVVMFHPGKPGEEAVSVERHAYRLVWYPIGWRSDDDPGFTGQTNAPPPSSDRREFAIIAPGFSARVQALLSEAANRRVHVQAWGGSTTIGMPGASDPKNTAWPRLLREALCDTYGDGGSGYWNVSLGSTTGTWTLQSFPGTAGAEFRATAAASITWTGVEGTTVRILHRNVNLTGSFRYRIDGGSFTTATPPTAFGLEPGVVEVSGLADTPHTVEVEWVSGTVGINGVEGSRDTGIVMQTCATGGRGFSDYDPWAARRANIGITNTSGTITSVAPGHFTSADIGRYLVAVSGSGVPDDALITAVASATSATISPVATATGTRQVDFCDAPPTNAAWPQRTFGTAFSHGLSRGQPVDLAICEYGINDGGSSLALNIERSADGVSRVISQGGPEGVREVVMLGGHHGAFSTGGGPTAIRGMGAAIAAGMSGAYVDIWSRGRRSFAYWDGLDYFADAIHPSDAGHAQIANELIALLT